MRKDLIVGEGYSVSANLKCACTTWMTGTVVLNTDLPHVVVSNADADLCTNAPHNSLQPVKRFWPKHWLGHPEKHLFILPKK